MTGAIISASLIDLPIANPATKVEENASPAPMEIIGVKDRFGESGEPNELLEKFGLTAKNIIDKTKEVIKRKI